MKQILLLVFLFLALSFIAPKALAQTSCDPYNCQPCTGTQKCIRVGFGNYQCLEGKRDGVDCQPQIVGTGCEECANGLVCTRTGFGRYMCMRVNAVETDAICDGMPQDCADCFAGTGRHAGNPGAWTAIGCIPTDPSLFIAILLRFAIGVAGGIAFLLILFGGFQMMTSAGNPERLNGGKELVSSAVTGLLLIIFSIFLLKVIGVDILGIPGFR